MNLIGNVENKSCILYDDMIDTGGTIVQAAEALLKKMVQKKFMLVVSISLLG